MISEKKCFLYIGSKVDTERVNKTLDKIERRFAKYNETQEEKGKRDRTKEEVFLHENHVVMKDL